MLFAQAIDPHRGMYVEKLLMLQPQTANSGFPRVDRTESILGNSAKEDSLLQYCMENHITYITLDAYRIMRYDTSNDDNQDHFPLMHWLCEFMDKARNQFCITQIAATGSSNSYFDNVINYDTTAHFNTPPVALDSSFKAALLPDTSLNRLERIISPGTKDAALVEYLKTVYRILQLGGMCQEHFDFIQLDYEFWNYNGDDYTQFADDPQTKWDSVFVPLLLHVNLIKQAYNALHPVDTIGISVYCRLGQNTASVDSAHAVFMDGGVGVSRKVDRVFAVYYVQNPDAYYNSYGFYEEGYWHDSTTNRFTDYHPLFSSEAVSLGGYANYLGNWLASEDTSTIFMAERIFFDDWWTYRWAGSDFENGVEPGGFQWFSSLYMSDRLKNPTVLMSSSPTCTAAANANVNFNYVGPLEELIYYYFTLVDKNSNVVRRDSGYTNDYAAALNTITLPQNVNLAVSGSPFRATLSLIYESNACTYTDVLPVSVTNSPALISLGDTILCEGGWTFLRASSGTQWIWFKNGVAVDTTVVPTFRVNESGIYSCSVTGAGGCNGMTNAIHVVFNSNPSLSILSTCLTDSVQLTVLPITAGTNYYWNNGDTATTIYADVNGLYTVTAMQSNGCSTHASQVVHTDAMTAPVATIHLIGGDSAYCRYSFNDTLIFQTESCYQRFEQWISGTDTSYSYSNPFFNDPTAPTVTTNYVVTTTNQSGCKATSAPYTISVDTACCSGSLSINSVDSSSNHSNFSSSTYAINDIFYINNNFTIVQSHVLMGINGKIIVKPGATLSIDNADIYSCNGMWDGITLTDSTSHLIMYTRDTIMDARNAILSNHGASISIDSAYFNRNNKAIVIKNYNGVVNASIKRSTFACEDSSHFVTTMKNGMYSVNGIYLDSIGSITIGDTSSAHKNYFRHLYYGIKAEASSLTVQNCDFHDMRRYAYTYSDNARAPWYTYAYDGYAIYNHNTNGAAATQMSIHKNNFKECGWGVASFNNIGNDIAFNTFDSLRFGAAIIRNPAAVTVSIHDNSITHFYNGLSLYELRLATSVSILNNFFDTPSQLNPAPNDANAVNWSVKLQSKLPGNTNATVANNRMVNQLKGIYQNGCASTSITGNYISLVGYNNAAKQYGIWLVSSDSVLVQQDSVLVPTNTLDTSVTHERAIRFEASKNCRIKENYILNATTGVNGLNYCDYTLLSCNKIINSARGMLYENITLPTQGASGMPQDNKWYNIALANRCVGSGNPIEWYHRYLQNDPTNKFSPGTYPTLVNSFPNQTGISQCADSLDTLQIFISPIINKIITDSIVFPYYDFENKTFAKEFAFRLLAKDSMLMYRGLPTDVMYQQFFAEMKERNIGKYIDIKELLGNKEYAQALSKLFTVQDSNLIEQNYKMSFQYLTWLLKDEDYELTNEDSSTMDFATSQLAIEGGEAIYILRAIMDEEYDDNITGGLFRNAQEFHPNPNTIESKIFPNPNTGTFIYEYQLSDSCCYEIVISDFSGRKIYEGKLNDSNGILQINFPSQNGIYFLTVIREAEIVDWKKIIKIN